RSGPSRKVSAIGGSAVGATIAAPMPCAARAMISQVSLVAKPPASEPSVNTTMPGTNIRRRPNRSPARPPRNSNPPKVRAYALITHSRSVGLNFSARWIDGRAMFTIVPSSTTINCVTAITMSARRKFLGSGETLGSASTAPEIGVLMGRTTPTSGMDLGGEPQVKTNGLHDPEGGARGEHVRGGEHPGVLLDDGGRGRVRAGVDVSLDGGPGVLPVLHEERSWIDGGKRLSDTGVDVGHVLLVQRDVIAGAKPAKVAADVVLPRVGKGVSRGRDVPRNVFGEVRDVNRRPATVHDVDEHQRVVIWEMDIGVVGRVIRAMPGQL